MKRLSEKITAYVIKTGAVSEEFYAVYQYGFQIGLEMSCCFAACLGIAVYLHMVPGFIVFTGIFMWLRTYAGGVHLNSFGACFVCSVTVQTLTLLAADRYQFPAVIAWAVILTAAILIWKASPVESADRELDSDEKEHCRQVTVKILIGILAFAVCCTISGISGILSLIAMVFMVVLASQYIGIAKYRAYKMRMKNSPGLF